MRTAATDRDPLGTSASDAAAGPQALLLGQIAIEGILGMFRVLRRATAGDRDAGSLQAAAVVRALPGMGALMGHEVLLRAHIPDRQPVGELNAEQRVALCRLATRVQRLTRRAR